MAIRTIRTIRSVQWLDGSVPAVRLLDQTQLPGEEVYVDATDVDTLVSAIRRLAVRGAPALGAVGAPGVVVASAQGAREGWTTPACTARSAGCVTPAPPP